MAREFERELLLDALIVTRLREDLLDGALTFSCISGSPVSLLRKAASLVRPGETVAFHEVRPSSDTKSFPYVPLWDMTTMLVRIALQSSVPNFYGADRLVEHFSEAGLPFSLNSKK